MAVVGTDPSLPVAIIDIEIGIDIDIGIGTA